MRCVLLAGLLLLVATLGSSPRAYGQAMVVTTCGTPPGGLVAGQVRQLYIDVNGNLCSNATSSPPTSQYPSGAVAVTASATGTTLATTATLPGVAANYTFLCGFSIRANATAAATGNSTVTGTISGTLNFTQWTAPLASGLGVTEEIFTPCVPSSAVNTAIAAISAAPGAGGVVSVTAWGYYKTTTP